MGLFSNPAQESVSRGFGAHDRGVMDPESEDAPGPGGGFGSPQDMPGGFGPGGGFAAPPPPCPPGTPPVFEPPEDWPLEWPAYLNPDRDCWRVQDIDVQPIECPRACPDTTEAQPVDRMVPTDAISAGMGPVLRLDPEARYLYSTWVELLQKAWLMVADNLDLAESALCEVAKRYYPAYQARRRPQSTVNGLYHADLSNFVHLFEGPHLDPVAFYIVDLGFPLANGEIDYSRKMQTGPPAHYIEVASNSPHNLKAVEMYALGDAGQRTCAVIYFAVGIFHEMYHMSEFVNAVLDGYDDIPELTTNDAGQFRSHLPHQCDPTYAAEALFTNYLRWLYFPALGIPECCGLGRVPNAESFTPNLLCGFGAQGGVGLPQDMPGGWGWGVGPPQDMPGGFGPGGGFGPPQGMPGGFGPP